MGGVHTDSNRISTTEQSSMMNHLKSRIYDTGWQICTGCLKLQVSFRERATNYKALLRKMTNKDKASYGSSPPCRRMNA